MLLEEAIGDGYGCGFEYAPFSVVRECNNLSAYIQHRKHTSIIPGSYTDDTQMSLALAEAMLEDDPWTPESLAERFVNVFKRDERTGYAGRFYEFLCSINNGSEFLERINPDSDKSGGAMRNMVTGLHENESEVMRRSKIQCAITHNTKMGIAAANASALTTHYFFKRKGPKSDLGEYLNFYVPEVYWNVPYRDKVGAKGWMSVHAAVTAIVKNTSMSGLLVDCIAYTGDVDTVAAVALAAASWSDEYEQDLPPSLLNGLENDAYGKDYLIKLDEQLKAKYPR